MRGRRVVASLFIILLKGCLCQEVPEGSKNSCLLQVHRATAARDGCSLPANGQWCQVRVGHAEFKMAVYNTADIVSNSICSSGTWELQPSDVTALGEPGNALDIGANVGFYSFVLAAYGWNVTSFEPMSANHELLDATMCANPELEQRINLHKFGLGPKDDHCVIISSSDNFGDGMTHCGDGVDKAIEDLEALTNLHSFSKRSEMDIRRLDDVLTEEHVEKIDFVKMDVEGFECQVMAGGQSLLTKFRPKLIQSEVWPDMQGCQPQDYLAAFENASYSVTKDRACTIPDATRPVGIDNRYMCRQLQETGSSLLEISALKRNERKVVWLKPTKRLHAHSKLA